MYQEVDAQKLEAQIISACHVRYEVIIPKTASFRDNKTGSKFNIWWALLCKGEAHTTKTMSANSYVLGALPSRQATVQTKVSH